LLTGPAPPSSLGGAVAADYDRYRPSYPMPLIDDLVDLHPATVLDVGCGTGKAATLLAARGLDVLGVEPDPAMAAVARDHGVPVEVGHFESWPDGGRQFDLITCAQAWHWVDPGVGIPKAARLLRPGGTVALFWNFDEVDNATRAVLDDVYDQQAPELAYRHAPGTKRPHHRSYVADLQSSGLFAEVTDRTYPWQRAVPIDEWINTISTHSDHLLLGAARLEALRTALHDALSARSDRMLLDGGTYLTSALAV
ncbi:class I SAM-dependent methyltransferase, partial [uncultured Jatrophihabitans sp.]|uniref:class I SAM-dependent methyltransferase n=1 Tax=uncultured Jatrophihabitans sp. TaxID=1610747 RepID=UPI0035C94D3D